MKRGQASVEFTILVAFGIIFLSVVSVGFLSQIQLLEEDFKTKELEFVANVIAENVNLAANTDGFFYRPFSLPPNIKGDTYNFLFDANPSDHLTVNSSFGDVLVLFNKNVSFVLGNSSYFCVTNSDGELIFANRVVSVEDDVLFFGCVENMKNVTLEFSDDPADSILADLYFGVVNVSTRVDGNNLTLLSNGLTGSLYVVDVDTIQVMNVVDIDDHLADLVVKI